MRALRRRATRQRRAIGYAHGILRIRGNTKSARGTTNKGNTKQRTESLARAITAGYSRRAIVGFYKPPPGTPRRGRGGCRIVRSRPPSRPWLSQPLEVTSNPGLGSKPLYLKQREKPSVAEGGEGHRSPRSRAQQNSRPRRTGSWLSSGHKQPSRMTTRACPGRPLDARSPSRPSGPTSCACPST